MNKEVSVVWSKAVPAQDSFEALTLDKNSGGNDAIWIPYVNSIPGYNYKMN